MVTRRQLLAGASCAALAVSSGVRAQSAYPDHPIRIVVGYAAGGGFDIVARLLGEPIKSALGQPVVVDHSAGDLDQGYALLAQLTVGGIEMHGPLCTFQRSLRAVYSPRTACWLRRRRFLARIRDTPGLQLGPVRAKEGCKRS